MGCHPPIVLEIFIETLRPVLLNFELVQRVLKALGVSYFSVAIARSTQAPNPHRMGRKAIGYVINPKNPWTGLDLYSRDPGPQII